MSYSSIYFQRTTNSIHWWEYDDEGNKVHNKEKAPLYFYMPSDDGEYTSIYGDKLRKIEFDSVSKMNDTRKMYKDAGRKLFESDIAVENRFVLDQWKGQDLKIPDFDVHYLDIEVHSDEGFPHADAADHPVTAITVWSTKKKKFFIFAEKEFNTDFLKNEDGEVPHWVKFFDSEEELLETYIKFVNKFHPDVISGWNSNGFDIPYIVNRCTKLLGSRKTSKLSPIGVINRRKRKSKFGKEYETITIGGINCIDYLELYKNYHFGEQESYKLDYIARVEIDAQKLEYEGSLKDLYYNDWQHYIEYNVQDVQLLIDIDEKLQFMSMMIGICYNCRVPLEQYATTTKVLDGAFISRLMLDNIILPDVSSTEKDDKYVGAFVKDPDRGVHEWIVSYDATSLYPSIMMQHNISPETKVCKLQDYDAKVIMAILGGEDVGSDADYEAEDGLTYGEWAAKIKENNYSIASNGAVYRHDAQGIVPRFVEEWFHKRKHHKKLMLAAESAHDHDEAKLQTGLQLNYKILINSVYGYLGTEYSRLYDPHNAIAVTTVGQECLKATISSIDTFFKDKWAESKIGKKIGASSVPSTVVYGDTDSVYLCVGRVLDSFGYDTSDVRKTEAFLDNKISPIIVKVIDNAMEHVSLKRMNAPTNKIFFKREMIARRGIHLAKKRYVAWVLNMEGVNIEEGSSHELEVKGIEIVRSSTPEIVRKYLKDTVTNMIKSLDEKQVAETIKDIHKEFMNAEPVSISKTSTANNLAKYTDVSGLPMKGCPQHIKGAVLYNKSLKDLGLLGDYEEIFEGDKVKVTYVKPQDHYRSNCISFKGSIPKELRLNDCVDYELMWEKVFLKPLEQFYEILRWSIPDCGVEDIDDLFA